MRAGEWQLVDLVTAWARRGSALPRWLLSERGGLTGQGRVGYNMEAGREQQAVSRGSGSGVEHLLAKEKVAGSNPVSRSRRRRGQVVKARVCKTLITGSNPVVASELKRSPKNPAHVMRAGSFLAVKKGDLGPRTDTRHMPSRHTIAEWFPIPVAGSRLGGAANDNGMVRPRIRP
jgi:hypothetical protein